MHSSLSTEAKSNIKHESLPPHLVIDQNHKKKKKTQKKHSPHLHWS